MELRAELLRRAGLEPRLQLLPDRLPRAHVLGLRRRGMDAEQRAASTRPQRGQQHTNQRRSNPFTVAKSMKSARLGQRLEKEHATTATTAAATVQQQQQQQQQEDDDGDNDNNNRSGSSTH